MWRCGGVAVWRCRCRLEYRALSHRLYPKIHRLDLISVSKNKQHAVGHYDIAFLIYIYFIWNRWDHDMLNQTATIKELLINL